MRLKVLGIDTATWTASIGVRVDGRTAAERSLRTQGSLAFSLLALVEETLADADIGIADLDAVAVSVGPGSFTGLRIGLASAKGLAFARGLELVGVPTLEALAFAAEVEDGLVCPLLDARKGQVYTGLYLMKSGRAVVEQPEVAVSLDPWLERLGARRCTFIGDAARLVEAKARGEWRLLPFDRYHPRGAIVARLGEERLTERGGDVLADLEPFYVRPSEAEQNLA